MNTELALIIIGVCGIALSFLNLRLRAKNKVLSASLRGAESDARSWKQWSDLDVKARRDAQSQAHKLRTENEELRVKKDIADGANDFWHRQANALSLQSMELRAKCQELSAENEELAKDVDFMVSEERKLQAVIDDLYRDLGAVNKTKDFLYAQVRRASKPASVSGFIFAGPQEARKPATTSWGEVFCGEEEEAE